MLPLAGFRASTGALNVVLVWLTATAGSVLGALVLYGLGAWLGYDRLLRLADRPWFVITSRKDLERGHEVFRRHGRKVVLLARCVPFLRSVVSIPAGVVGMGLVTFVTLTAIGSGGRTLGCPLSPDHQPLRSLLSGSVETVGITTRRSRRAR